MFTITSTFFFNTAIFHEVGWYMTIYFVAAYIRVYPSWWTESKKVATYALCGTVFLSWLSVLTVDFVGSKVGFSSYYWMVLNSNKLFALIVGVSTFLLFKNLRIKQNLFIYKVASTTFGVLCIHASSNAMRTFLWGDLLRVREMYSAHFGILLTHALLSAVGVFVLCSIIDYIRMITIEKALFSWIDVHQQKIKKFAPMYMKIWLVSYTRYQKN